VGPLRLGGEPRGNPTGRWSGAQDVVAHVGALHVQGGMSDELAVIAHEQVVGAGKVLVDGASQQLIQQDVMREGRDMAAVHVQRGIRRDQPALGGGIQIAAGPGRARAVEALWAGADGAIRSLGEQTVEARIRVLLAPSPDALLQGLLEEGMVVLRQREDDLLPLTALLHMPPQLLEGFRAQRVEHVQVAGERGQRDEDANAHAHLDERRAGERGRGVVRGG